MEHQHIEILLALQCLGKLPHDLWVFQITPLCHLHHQEMMPNDQPETIRCRLIHAHAIRHVFSHAFAFAFVAVSLDTFTRIMQQQSEIQGGGSVDFLKHLAVFLIPFPAPFPQAVELFDAYQRVFIHRILVKKLVLHQAGETAEFGHVFAE